MKYSKRRKVYIALSAIVLIAIMIIIFVLSAQNGEESSSTSGFFTELIGSIFGQHAASEAIIRTLAHFCEFAGLGFLVCNFIFALKDKLRPFLSIILSSLYATSDEIHQYFVPERACQLSDLAIDCCGIVAGIAVFCVLNIIVIKFKNKKPH